MNQCFIARYFDPFFQKVGSERVMETSHNQASLLFQTMIATNTKHIIIIRDNLHTEIENVARIKIAQIGDRC